MWEPIHPFDFPDIFFNPTTPSSSLSLSPPQMTSLCNYLCALPVQFVPLSLAVIGALGMIIIKKKKKSVAFSVEVAFVAGSMFASVL